ncbi:uncharacterized protein LOC131175918 [Hevea brasiliensis]|uniref:uncharacterized protein LOC131175918 n=1 Tax=Hevea brasiliensis TaxID=3981 RepID=UPI0025EC1956|nr:uncharacterized protein LOC131175918 [Hevea brasiliensis]
MKKPLVGVYELDAMSMFNAKFDALTRKMDKLSMKVDSSIGGSSHTEDVGTGNIHCINGFPSYGQEFGNEQVDFVGNYNQKSVEEKKKEDKDKNEFTSNHDEVNEEANKKKEIEKEEEEKYVPPTPYKPPLPYPQRFQKAKLDKQFENFLEVLKKLYINIPFTDAISQMPSYTKFLKEILSNKRRLEDYETVALTEECSAFLQNKLPLKLKDPGSFSIPCHIGDTSIEKTLCDLGASVSLMPLSICEKLKVGDLKPTTISLPLADKSIKYPVGILENVQLKVGKFFIPVDFVVLEMEEDIHISIMLGRPFLPTAGPIIDVKNDRLTLKVGEEEVEFNLNQNLKKHHGVDPCLRVDVIDEIVEAEFKEKYPEDPLENCLVHSRTTKDENPKVEAFAQILEATQEVVGDQVLQVEELKYEVAQPSLLDEKDAPKVDLKPLPSTLRYTFLGPNSTYPVIINANLSDVQVEKLLRELRAHRKVIGYTIDDIKGINPILCMHRILLEDNFKPTVEHQRRLNPNMKEVVKKEVLKLLEAGIIYHISDSSWVSPVHVVPKKGGVTVVKNENNELIPTRIVTGWRMCIDYRKLNSATRKDHFPLPFIDQMLERGIEVDKAKVEVIEKMPLPTSVKGIRSFLGHAGFYRRFIKDFSKIAKPLTNLLNHDVPFNFDHACFDSYNRLKEALTIAPIMQPPDWSLPFEIMCDASDFTVGAVLGQKKEKRSYAIYYANKTLDDAQVNYAITEKEFLAVVFAVEKFRAYLVGSKVIVYTDHAAIRYLMNKKETKPRLIRWVLLLQEFDL